MNGKNNEHELIAQVSSKHKAIAASFQCEFINTEESGWIHDCMTHDLKPDGLVSRHGLYNISKQTVGEATESMRQHFTETAFLFGKGIWEIRDMYQGIIKWKLKCVPKDRGTLYNYLQHLSRGDPMNVYRGILYDRSHFVCAASREGGIISCLQGNLTDVGSFEYLQKFLSHRSIWLRLLDALCDMLQVKLHVLEHRESAFLGAGKYGRCFSVKRINEDEVYALKCVLTLDRESGKEIHALVDREFNLIRSMEHVPRVVKVVKDSLTTVKLVDCEMEIELGIGYLMTEVHTPISREMCKDLTLRKKIGSSLVYFHSRDLYHGDAQLVNSVIDKDGEIVWVDWMCSVSFMTRATDARALVQSTYGMSIIENHPMRECLSKYNTATSTDELQMVMDTMMGFDVPDFV